MSFTNDRLERNETDDEDFNENQNEDQDTISNNLPHDNQSSIESDADLLEDDKKSLARHNKQYSELLEAYVILFVWISSTLFFSDKNLQEATIRYIIPHEIWMLRGGARFPTGGVLVLPCTSQSASRIAGFGAIPKPTV